MMKWLQKYWRQVAISLIVILLSAGGSLLPLKQAVKAVSDWVEHLGPLGLFAYVGIYALGTVLFFPGSLLTIASSLVFGLGMLAAWLGAVLGSTFAFLRNRLVSRVRALRTQIDETQTSKDRAQDGDPGACASRCRPALA